MVNKSLIVWWMGASAVLVCVGSVGPWASVLFLTVNGTKGDGVITLLLGLVGLLFVVASTRYKPPRPAWPSLLVTVCGVAAGAAGAYDWSNIQGLINNSDNEFITATASVGWGLVVVTMAGWSLGLAGFVSFLGRSQAPSSGPENSGSAAARAVADDVMGDDDSVERLTKLAQLKDAGIVSEEEFEAKKKELLLRL